MKFFWGIALTAGISGMALAADGRHCRPWRGKIVSEYATENCASPVGLCTRGKFFVEGYGVARTFYTVTAVGPTPTDPTLEKSVAYAGKLVVSTRHGDVIVEDLGLIDRVNGLVSSQGRVVGGTHQLQGFTGNLFAAGDATATGFAAVTTGKLCPPFQN